MISVLTVNYFSAVDLRGLIDSMNRHADGIPLQLIVTNNSPTESLDFAVRPGDAHRADFPITLIDSPNIGFGAGINLAAREARGDFLLIVNPDVRIQPDTFRLAIQYLIANPKIGVLLPRLRYPEGVIQPSVRRFYTWPVVLYARSPFRVIGSPPGFFRHYLYEDTDLTRPLDVDWGLGAAMFLRREDFADATIFDDRFFLYFEDVDLCHRTWSRGQRVVFHPGIECIHEHRRSSAQPVSTAGWRHFQSLLKFVSKYRGLPQRPVSRKR